MKKEWLIQFVAFLILFLNRITFIEHQGLFFSDTIGLDFLILLYHMILFLFVNYFLIPKLFYPKKYLAFFGSLILAILFFGIVEEGFLEKILSPDIRGVNDVTWQSICWFFGEIIVPLLTFMSIKFVFDNFSQMQKLEKIEQNKLRNELKFLKSQVQPHILFNSLNNLYHFALEKSDKLPDLILKLSNVLRYVVYDAAEEKVPLNKELSFIKDFVDLQKVQYSGRGTILYKLQMEPVSESVKIAPFLLIPFIENSFKHSFGTKIKGIELIIDITIKGHDISMQIENNFEENKLIENELIQGGIGLQNAQKRLEILYPNRHKLEINIIGDKYIVHLNLTAS